MLKIILTGVFVLSMICASAQTQENEVKASSATDSEVTIHEGKRVKATSPQKTFKPKYTSKKKKVVNVSEAKPKVYKTSKRQQRRNNKTRINARD